MLSEVVDRHIALHRATGYLFREQGDRLRQYARFAEAKGEAVVRAATALEWAGEGPSTYTRQRRLKVIRRFALLAHAEDERHEVPPAGAFGRASPRRTPYIYTPDELAALLKVASELGPRDSLRPKMYVTLFGLVAATGLRISEAIHLNLDDVTNAGLVIRQSKFRKSRLVPVHPTTGRVLSTYIKARAEFTGADEALFLSERHTRVRYHAVIKTFLQLARGIGLHPGPGQHGPRIHDLRHTFAVRSLEQCATNGEAVARHMLALSTYLGHAHLYDTYWYLQATPRLLADVAVQGEFLAHRGGS
jgi:integrase